MTVFSPISDAIALGAMPAPTRAAYDGHQTTFTGQDLRAGTTHIPTPTGAHTVTQTVGTSFTSPLDKGDFLYDFYNRIWVFPPVMSLLNPRIGQAQPFQIWNAFLDYSPNVLSSIASTGAASLSLSFSSLSLPRLQYADVSVTINNASIVNINAAYVFTFEEGVGTFTLLASLLSTLSVPAEAPITEVWNWKTDIFVGIDNTEQRVGLRLTPYRTMKQTLVTITDADTRSQMFKSIYDFNGFILIPYWQYSSALSVAGSVGDTTLSFNTAYTDIRAGEYVFLSDPTYTNQQIAVVATVTSGGCTLANGLQANLPLNSTICPALTSTIADKWALSRYAVNSAAKLEINTTTSQGRSTLSRPNSIATILYYGLMNLPILSFARPVMESETQSVSFETHVDKQDYAIGNVTLINNWNYTETLYSLSYLIHRVTTPNDMDWWRDFGTAIIGSLKPFLLPTWRSDLLIISTVTDETNTFTVSGSDYYYLWQTSLNRQLMLQTSAGITYATVSEVALDGGGDTVITLYAPLPTGYNDVVTVSLLLVVRLEGDRFTFKHSPMDTTVSLIARTVSQ